MSVQSSTPAFLTRIHALLQSPVLSRRPRPEDRYKPEATASNRRLAKLLAIRIDLHPRLRRLAPVTRHLVYFTALSAAGAREDELNARIVAALRRDGHISARLCDFDGRRVVRLALKGRAIALGDVDAVIARATAVTGGIDDIATG